MMTDDEIQKEIQKRKELASRILRFSRFIVESYDEDKVRDPEYIIALFEQFLTVTKGNFPLHV